jgi:hypothetical protein
VPAAAVIPAPIAYIKVVAVKKLVVGSEFSCQPVHLPVVTCWLNIVCRVVSWCSSPSVLSDRCVYFEKIRVLKAGLLRLNNVAWNNGIGPRFYFVGLRNPEVMIKRDRRGHWYCGARGEILGPSQDELKRKHLPRMFSLIKNES